MLTAPIHPINKNDNRYLVEFHDVNNQVVGVCPLYVTGVAQTASGTGIRIGRGAVADQFNVKDSPREVIDRLREAFEQMHDSFLAGFLGNDLSPLEDRILARLTADMNRIGTELKGNLKSMVNREIELMAASDTVAREVEKLPISKKKTG